MALEQECCVTCIAALGVKLLDYIFADIECSDLDLLPCSYVVQELDSVIIIVTDSITWIPSIYVHAFHEE